MTLTPIKLSAYAVISAVIFQIGWQVNGWRLQGEIDQLHAAWNEAYANQAQATLDKERAINELNMQIEVNNEAQAKAIDVV